MQKKILQIMYGGRIVYDGVYDLERILPIILNEVKNDLEKRMYWVGKVRLLFGMRISRFQPK